ncbi:MAG: heavy-metal-associated domain-containing protein [Candidatus Berkiella sp.]
MYFAFGSQSEEQTHSFSVSPMRCEKCVEKIRIGLSALNLTNANFSVSIENKRLTVTAPTSTSVADIIAALQAAGTTATHINLNTTAQPSSAPKPWSGWF